MKPMLEVRGLAAGYGPAQVLFDVSLAIDAGEVVTLLGRNGMGKTTTINTIMGIVPARAGEATFQGRPLLGLPSYAVAQAGIGLVPEGRQIFPRAFSGRESGCHRDLPLRPQPLDARARLRALPRADRAAQTHGRSALRRRATNACDWPRVADQSQTAHPRRGDRRTRPR